MVLLTMVLTKYALIDSLFFSNISFKKYTLIHTTYLGVTLTHYQFAILSLSVLFITAGGYIINDIFDVDADVINKPSKVLIGKPIAKKNAWFIYVIINLLGFILGTYISATTKNSEYSFIFLATILLLFLYSKYFKKTLLIGNLLVSVLLGLVIFITVVFNEPQTHTSNLLEAISNLGTGIHLFLIMITYIVFSILTNIIREIIKDIEDINGDLKIKAKTLPILLGRKRAAKVAFFFSSLLLVFLLIVLQSLKNDLIFLIYGIVCILIPLLYFMFKLWGSESKNDFSKLSNLMKIIMLFGILSMLLFKV
ncbi:geranylgeranylglycerol-phosphate geranylgeranyltransferase [Polaribacter sp. MSW13]|uniref:Geranylgeranylglycerol-phosphate geranylgeranyltransferase n=1 Tax=Polaribacter marinus TaxID=2916838 RepID=A0A9X1VL29_9FLAO|nr:geranylgeranylglycerol-phosphate geranylgeranyltransferase [Polaribacter marinus]MCI2228459.1 geranylgeranylglycerol-phosphate geranylgeranyltransferase [Polaribacter marinus]